MGIIPSFFLIGPSIKLDRASPLSPGEGEEEEEEVEDFKEFKYVEYLRTAIAFANSSVDADDSGSMEESNKKL